jgi:hypothetical protein
MYVWLIHYHKIVLFVEGGLSIMAQMIGKLVGTKAETRPKNLITSPVSGWIQVRIARFLKSKSAALSGV